MPSGMLHNPLPRRWRVVIVFAIFILCALGLFVVHLESANADQIISRERAQILSASLKNVGLCREFILGEAMTTRPERVVNCRGVIFSIEGESSGCFSIWVNHRQLFLERLIPPSGFYQKSLALTSVVDYFPLLYKNSGAEAVEASKRFASAVFIDGLAPEYSTEKWVVIAGPNLMANRASLTLVSVDGIVRVQMSLVALLRNGKCELEVCELEVKRKTPPTTPCLPVGTSVICEVEEVR